MNGRQDSTAIVPSDQPKSALIEWGGAAARGLTARREREAIINEVLVPDVDFGKIPGTDKPTLFKPGAEKIADALNLCPEYDPITAREDWEAGRFFYRYRCRLVLRGTEVAIATGLGSCNSMEDRYRWRTQQRACPKCKKNTIIKGNDKYTKGPNKMGAWVCWKKKDGCGAQFAEKDTDITSQVAGKVENEDPYTLVNTVDKMAQKRALVAAALNLGFSHKFTQDVEDIGPAGAEDERHVQRAATPPADDDQPPVEDEPGSNDPPSQAADQKSGNGTGVLTSKQISRLWAIAFDSGKKHKLSEEDIKKKVNALLGLNGATIPAELTKDGYESVCKALTLWGQP